MADDLAIFTLEQASRIWAAVRLVEASNQQGDRVGVLSLDSVLPVATNMSGETWPEFGVAQLTSSGILGNRPWSNAEKVADLMGVAGPVVVATDRDTIDEDRSTLQLGPIVRVLTDGSTLTPGTRWGVVVDEWHVAPDPFGQFLLIGADPIEDVGIFYQYPTPELMRAAKPDANITAGSSGTFSLYNAGTDTAQNVTAYLAWGEGGEDLASGTEGWVRWDIAASRWEWVGGDC